MACGTYGTIRLGLDNIEVSGGLQSLGSRQDLRSGCAAMAATQYRPLEQEATGGRGRISMDGYGSEVWHV